MSELLFSGETRSAGASFKLGCIGGLAGTVGVVGVVSAFFLLSGESMTPSLAVAVKVATPVGIIAAILLAGWTYRLHRASARMLTIRRKDDRLTFEIPPDVSFRGKLTCQFAWQTGMSHGAARTKLLWCDVDCDGELMVRLTHEIGGLHSVPSGWPEAQAPMSRQAKHGGFTLSQLPRLVGLLERAS